MSADEDTELRDLVAQTLETNGVLGKIRAQLRASVFLALEEQESLQGKQPLQNPAFRKLLSTKDGQAVVNLIREFLDFYNLEFTQAVFEPESNCGSNYDSRGVLAKELNIHEHPGATKMPLLLEVLQQSQGEKVKGHGQAGRSTGAEPDEEGCVPIPQELTSKQLADARQKFEYYDRDKNNAIDKDELRDLFLDMFPSFNKNMLDRYVNDEFRAADRDISNRSYFSITSRGISFQEFVGMYKRLFLQCRSVVATDVSDILSPTSPNKSLSSPLSKASNSEHSLVESRNQRNLENGPKHLSQDNNTDTEEDFFDDPVPTTPTGGYKPFGSQADSPPTDSQRSTASSKSSSRIPVYSALRSEDKPRDKPTTNGIGGQKSGAQGRSPPSGGMSSLQGLPSLSGERNPPRKSPTGDTSDNLRAMDKRMADLGLDGDGQDFSYEDDFQSEGHSISQKSPRTRSEANKDRSQGDSIVEEIEEDIEELSIEGDDLLRSEKSAFDDMTTDRTISQHESGFDYIEDLQSP